MGHYDNCRPGYCGKCGAAPGNLVNGVCPFCNPPTRTDATGTHVMRLPSRDAPVAKKAGRRPTVQRSYVPCTPAGTPLMHLESDSVKEAWDRLLVDAAHMPYKTKENFEKRGYTVEALK